jgi:opacity protein-like surface antigen
MSARRTITSMAVVAALLAVVALSGSVAAAPPQARPRFAPACPSILPATNVWNKRVDSLPVRSDSNALIAFMGTTVGLHPDFGTFAGYGIPVNAVRFDTPRSNVDFWWPDESDPGPYAIPASPKIEGNGAGGDRHLLMVDPVACKLWELYAASHASSGWTAGSGAIYALNSNALRPDGWTSADAAGLPIYPGLARYNEVAAGVIAHALRFTVPTTRIGVHLYPARHDAGSSNDASAPPMGLRLRLKAGVDISGYGPQSRVILTALKRYGMILADNGTGYYISGAPDPGWDDDELHALGGIKGSMFEVVNTTGFVNG